MAKLILSTTVTINGAFDAPAPDKWLVLDDDSGDDTLNLLRLGDALLMGRKTYEGLSAVWPNLTEDPTLGRYARDINAMPKYVASRTLSGSLEWNATLLSDPLESAVTTLKGEHSGNIVITGTGQVAHDLFRAGLIDEYWSWVHPFLWPEGPRVLEGVGPTRMDLIAATPYASGVVCLRYRLAT